MESSRIKKKLPDYLTKDIYRLWFTQDKNGKFVTCVSQYYYALICLVVANVIIFQVYEKIFGYGNILSVSLHVPPTIRMCMVFEKKKRIEKVHVWLPYVLMWNVALCDLQVLPKNSQVVRNIKHDNVIFWRLGVSVEALSKVFFGKKEGPHPKPTGAVPRTQVIICRQVLWTRSPDVGTGWDDGSLHTEYIINKKSARIYNWFEKVSVL